MLLGLQHKWHTLSSASIVYGQLQLRKESNALGQVHCCICKKGMLLTDKRRLQECNEHLRIALMCGQHELNILKNSTLMIVPSWGSS